MAGPFYFAWAGAAIQPQVTLVVNGNTHGGTIYSAVIVGDIGGYLGDQQIRNIADVGSLEAETLYRVDATTTGITPGSYFLFDGNASGLSALPDSVNLNSHTAAANSVQINLTKAINVGEVVATFTAGSSIVLLPGVDFPAGIYAISGSDNIGETPTPPRYGTIGAPPTLLTTALFAYDGSSGTADMFILAATPTLPLLPDALTGPQNVASQSVTAVAGGQVAVSIAGMPDQDWHSLTHIPTGALAELTPGLQYNIAGNGIQNGTTFICPARGATAIELDLPATSSEINGLFTITGPRTPSEPFDPTIHNRFDENVMGFEISQEEGNFATLDVTVQNPNVGLLAVGRNLWCWLSYDQNWNTGGAVDLVPLFNGRLVGVPKLQAGEIVQLQFLARPDDFTVQKDGLAASLSVLPYYDPVWLVTNVNPDTVLETYSALWHIDRVSLGVTTSDILSGEDGTITIGEDQAFYDNFSLTYGEAPLTSIAVSGTVNWQQEADGQVNVTGPIYSAFTHAGSTPYGLVGGVSAPALYGGYSSGFGWTAGFTQYAGGPYLIPPGQLISMLNGDGLFQDWPKPGTSIGGGWSLSTYTDDSGFPLCFIAEVNQPDGYLTNQYYPVNAAGNDPTGPNNNDFVLTATASIFVYQYQFKLTTYSVRMVLQYEASRKRTETVSAVLVADVQRELSDNADSDPDTINLSSEYVGLGVDEGGLVPIGYLSRRSYFQTDRGTLSFQYLLLLARAKMRARARAVDITFGVDFPTSLGLTLRNSVTLFDRRLPGGSATGKIKSYKITMGDGGLYGEFTIGCAIGNGNPVTPAVGVNAYVDDGYVNIGYQVIAGGQDSLIADELAYQPLDDFVIADDGIDFSHLDANSAVNTCVVNNGLTAQMAGLNPGGGTPPFPWMPVNYTLNGLSQLQIATTLHTTVLLDMKPVNGGEFHTAFFPAVSLLALPKAIDLSAVTEVRESVWDSGSSTWDSGSSTWDHA